MFWSDLYTFRGHSWNITRDVEAFRFFPGEIGAPLPRIGKIWVPTPKIGKIWVPPLMIDTTPLHMLFIYFLIIRIWQSRGAWVLRSEIEGWIQSEPKHLQSWGHAKHNIWAFFLCWLTLWGLGTLNFTGTEHFLGTFHSF